MKALTLLIILLFPMAAQAADDAASWTTMDTVLQLTFTAVTVVDWAQTLRIARGHDDYVERNSLLGDHPSEGRVNSYFAAGIVAHAAVSYALPKPWRTMWQCFWIGGEVKTVSYNINAGLRLSF